MVSIKQICKKSENTIMWHTILVSLGIFVFFPLSANESHSVVVGTLLNSGLMLRTSVGILELSTHGFTHEFSELSNTRVKVLCEKVGKKCRPLRYEPEPFVEDKEVPDWTFKKIPKYVYRGEFSFNPQVTPDGKKLFWTTLTKGTSSVRSTQKIWTSEKDDYGFWKPGWQMEAPLNNRMPSAVISALPGGNELFIFGNFGEEELINQLKKEMEAKSEELIKSSENRKEYEYKMTRLQQSYKEKSEKIFNRAPLYKTQKDKNYWGTPIPISFPSFYNTYKKPENPNQQIFGGSALSSSGKILIYSAQQSLNVGKLDLYVSFMNQNGEFSPGVNLGTTINTAEEEMAPFLGPDDKTLYFSSNGKGNELSIFVTKRLSDNWDKWTTPIEISNRLRGVNFFSIPASSEWAYVSREGDLYMAKIPKDFRPESVFVVLGKVTDDSGNPLSTTIRYESLKTKKQMGIGVSDPKTGFFSIVLPYGENYGFYAEKNGYLPVSKNLNLELSSIDNSSSGNKKESHVTLILPKIEIGKEITLNNLFFETGKSEIKKESESELYRLIEILVASPSMEIVLEGHTDDVGKDDANIELSAARANAVKSFLTNQGKIAESRISTMSFGQSKPIVPNDSEENRAKNRRVVFRIKK
jgi:outer membrane protein OmpA-like peptidoglycan-associated protein